MRIRNWKYKAALQSALSVVPGGHRANFALQRLTGGLPISDSDLVLTAETARRHIEACRLHGATPPEAATFFEFGAGWDLHVPVLLAAMGARRQFLVDIRRLVRPELVFDVGRRVADLDLITHTVEVRPRPSEPLAAYLARLGIHYWAPRDARATGFDEHSVDFVTSTNTLEHIPPDDILAILVECHRFLRDDGILSFQVDFQDHWSYFDHTITPYNYLSVDESTWRRLNPPLHYQNRLRWSDYLDLYERSGFEVVEEEVTGGTPEDEAMIEAIDLKPPFLHASPEDLIRRGSRIVLRKATPTR